ncbi:MAG: hypothetical protein HKN03_02890 [Acidimicrobiales bacterium]|nr:hypothetical protein [Acidimicrobiales bacterium]
MPIGVIPSRFTSASPVLVAVSVWTQDPPLSDPDSHIVQSDISVVHEAIAPTDICSVGPGEAGDVRLALPLSIPARVRRQLLRRLGATEGVTVTTVVDAPIAVLANHIHGLATGALDHDAIGAPRPGTSSRLHVVLVGQSNGTISMVVADLTNRRLVAIGSVTTAEEIRGLVCRGRRPGPREDSEDVDLFPHASWAEVAPSVHLVVGHSLTDGQSHLVRDIFGPQTFVTARLGGDLAALSGLAHLHQLAQWDAPWPTARVHLGTGWTRQPGPLRSDAEEHLTRIRAGGDLRFSDFSGQPLRLRAGSVRAAGCVLPDRLGSQPRLRLVDDGRLLLFGPAGSRPLAARLRWPIPGSGNQTIGIEAVGDAGVELLDAESLPHHKASVESPLTTAADAALTSRRSR